VAEGTSLLRMHMAYTRIVGSNPTVSAKLSKKAAEKRLFSFLKRPKFTRARAMTSRHPTAIKDRLPDTGKSTEPPTTTF
jgi:hypothetical protein